MTTTTVYADAADGYLESKSGFDDEFDGYGGTYAAARAGTGTPGIGVATAGTSISVGQETTADFFAYFGVWEAFVGFDTSSIGTDTVSAAVLNATSAGDNSFTDFDIRALDLDWGTTVTTADWQDGTELAALTLRAHYATSGGFTTNSAYDFTDDAMPAGINKAGVTRLALVSSRTVSGTAPSGYENVIIKSADTTGTTSDPKLTVTHAASGGGTTVTPTTLSLTTTGYAPTVTATANQTVTPTTAALALTTYAPTVTAGNAQTITPDTAALTLTTYAPTVTAGGAQTVTPTTTSLALVTYAPTVTATAHQVATPTTLALTLATFAPSANIGVNVTPTTAALTLTTYAPTVATTVHQTVTPTTAALALSTFAPVVTATDPKTVTPGPLALTLTTYAPYVGSQLIEGGRGPRPGTASHPVPRGTAHHPVPRGTAHHPVPGGIA